MADSSMVLAGQTAAYTLYVLAILATMGWFAFKVTRGETSGDIKPLFFYLFVGLLVVIGISLHLITYQTIPWKSLDMNRSSIQADRVFEIRVAAHQFLLPAPQLTIHCGEKALFIVTSDDLTYGFGLFRKDNSMLFQMQVVPGHKNDILWLFDRPGVYSIRSTEYSGPAGLDMTLTDRVVVTCDDAGPR